MSKGNIAFRVDANQLVGSGHAMRCLTIARWAKRRYGDVFFVVSDEASRSFIEARGGCAQIVESNNGLWDSSDAEALKRFCVEYKITSLLIDSYYATDIFFVALHDLLTPATHVAYIDDLYTIETGWQSSPHRKAVDSVINYSFGIDASDYSETYSETVTTLLIGPRFAPIRDSFIYPKRTIPSKIKTILVTSGSTNPDRTLERFVEGALEALPECNIDVIVGGDAAYDSTNIADNVNLISGVTDMSEIMKNADLAISSAGTTVYELCASGLPSIIVPIVDNQLVNAKGIKEFGLGWVLDTFDYSTSDIERAVIEAVSNYDMRVKMSFNMRKMIDGKGAERIADAL